MLTKISLITCFFLLIFPLACQNTDVPDNSNQDLYWVQLALGNAHTCGLTNRGDVQCVGSNFKGQLGVGETDYVSSPKMHKVTDLQDVVNIRVGASDDTCAITKLTEAYCWGRNDYGQLGLGHNNAVFKPTKIEGIADGIKSLNLDGLRGYAQSTKGIWYKFGKTTLSSREFSKPFEDASIPSNAIEVVNFNFSSCYLTSSDGVYCGRNKLTQVPNNLMHLYAVRDKLCVLTTDGRVYCNQSINPDTHYDLAKLAIDDKVEQVAIGFDFICALVSTGSVYCVGDNSSGQLGNGTKETASTPQKVTVVTEPIKSITESSSDRSMCAITESNKAYCWGHDMYYKFGQTAESSTYLSAVPFPMPLP